MGFASQILASKSSVDLNSKGNSIGLASQLLKETSPENYKVSFASQLLKETSREDHKVRLAGQILESKSFVDLNMEGNSTGFADQILTIHGPANHGMGLAEEVCRTNIVEKTSWISGLLQGVQETAQHIYTNLTEGLSKLSQVDPVMVVAGGILVASLVQSVWNKTEAKPVDPISKEKRIYELVLRANSKRAQLQQKSKKVKRLSAKILQSNSKAVSEPVSQILKKPLVLMHSVMSSL